MQGCSVEDIIDVIEDPLGRGRFREVGRGGKRGLEGPVRSSDIFLLFFHVVQHVQRGTGWLSGTRVFLLRYSCAYYAPVS